MRTAYYLRSVVIFISLMMAPSIIKADEFSMPLNTGWNLISLPLKPTNTSIESVSASLGNQFSAIYSFDSRLNRYLTYIPGSSANDLHNMDVGNAFWVYMTAAGQLRYQGTDANIAVDMIKGWNMVGYSSTQKRSITDALASINSKYNAVYAFDNSRNNYIAYIPSVTTELSTMQPGMGYWVHATENATWTLPSTSDLKPPTNLTVAGKTDITVFLTWTNPPGYHAGLLYQVLRDNNVVTTVKGTGFTDWDLNPSSSYSYTVRTTDASGNISGPSNVVVATTNNATPSVGTITQKDPALKEIVPTNAKIQRIVKGLIHLEGPLWINDGSGYLLFNELASSGEATMKWTPDGKVSTYRKPSGGANGMTMDKEGRLVFCEYDGRRVARLEKNGSVTTLASRYQGKRLNKPNDLVIARDGSIYFTDPDYSTPTPKELDFQGVYRIPASGGELQLITKSLSRPNGIALSPDNKILYVANAHPSKKLWMAINLSSNGTATSERLFYDVTKQEGHTPDGLKVDTAGNLYCTGPGGIWIFAPDGRYLGLIKTPEEPSNCNWGDTDGQTLYITSPHEVYRIRLKIEGVRP
jgi:gluconolactonase